jgi:hypothetical protein
MSQTSTDSTSAIRDTGANSLRYARFGLAIPSPILRALEKRRIYCQPSVSIEHQHLAKRYVLRGTESGGAVSDLARYSAYVGIDGRPLPWLQPLDSLSGNGRHAIVIAPQLVRIEMLRVGRTYELAISKHALAGSEERRRPTLTSQLLFHGRQGTLAVELWEKENASLRGSVTPLFYSSGGEVRRFPEKFDEAIRKVTGALACLGCKHSHIAGPPQRLPSEV